jgi:hypothetical protein
MPTRGGFVSPHPLKIIVPACFLLTSAGWMWTPKKVLAARWTREHGGAKAPVVATRRADSLAINVVNTMPHPFSLSYQNGDKQTQLGNVEAGAASLVVIRDLQRDSVTVWASAPQHDEPFKKTFAVHSKEPALWRLE